MQKLLLLVLSGVTLLALSNHEVALKSDEVMNGFEDASTTMEMTLINARGQKRLRTMKMKVLEGEAGDKSLMEFLSPADVKGTKFLSYEHIDKDDDQWLYLPALKRVKRIASKNRSGAFMGSEFSYEDLSSFNVAKYRYEGEAELTTLDGAKVYRSERVPVSKYSGYTKQVSWVDAQSYLIQKVEYFDRKKEHLKTAIFSDYRQIEGVWRIGKIRIINHQNHKESILVWKEETIKNGFGPGDFQKRVLKR